jgi:predicted permease
MTAHTPMFAPLNLGDRARLTLGQIVTSNHFDVLGIRPTLGRLLRSSDDEPGAERVVVLSYRMWQRDFGGDDAVVGRALQLRGQPYAIVGVAPASFTGVIPLIVPDLWVPITAIEEVEPAGINDNVPSPTGRTRLERRGSRSFFVKGRLRPGVSVAEANAQVALLGTRLASAHPETNRNRRMSAFATRDVRFLVPQAGGPLALGSGAVMSVVGLVLLIACANVAGMLLARASARRREIAVRLAIGASRLQLVRQMLAEGLALGLGGAVVALGLAWALVRLLLSMRLPLPSAVVFDLRLDSRVLLFGLAVAAVSGLLAALTPALRASALTVAGDLRGGRAESRVAGRRWALMDAMVAGQLAVTAVLLVVAGLLLRSLGAARTADVGFRVDGIAMVSTDTGMVRYEPARRDRFWADALARVRAIPGVESAALVSPRVPFDVNFSQTSIRIDGKAYAPDDRGELVSNVAVTPGYFETLGVTIVEGRGVDAGDVPGKPLVAVVNQTMARRFWPERSAVGGSFTTTFGRQQYQVIGIVSDHRLHTVGERPAPYLHVALAQRPSPYAYVLARTRGDASALVTSLRRELLALEPGLVFVGSSTMDAWLSMSLLPERAAAMLASGFSALGTLLAAIGVYGVIAFSVARRTREIGVRMAVGAERRTVLSMVMRQGLLLLMVGGGLGLVVAAVAARLLSGALYGVHAFDPAAWGGAMGVLAASAAAANVIPARRAMRVEPAVALRTE